MRLRSNQNARFVGIAIDPGYDFLENLLNEGFTVPDVDLVVITHAHPDHTENLTNFLTLLRERRKRLATLPNDSKKRDSVVDPADHRVLLAMTEGVFQRYRQHLFAERKSIRDIVVLKAEGWRGCKASEEPLSLIIDQDGVCQMHLAAPDPSEDCIATVRATSAWHYDGSEHDAIGVTIEWRGNSEGCTLGILSDTRYDSELYTAYSKCSVVVAHVGSLLSASQYRNYHNTDLTKDDLKVWLEHLSWECAKKKCEKVGRECARKTLVRLLKEKNHLYLPGLTRLVCDLRPTPELLSTCDPRVFPLLVLSEFGEELRGGLRVDLADKLSHFLAWRESDDPSKEVTAESALPIVPADVGLRVDITTRRVFCSICHRYVDFGQIKPISVFPAEEALGYVCFSCRKARGAEVPKLLEEWCTTGRPVIPLDESRLKQGRKPEPAG